MRKISIVLLGGVLLCCPACQPEKGQKASIKTVKTATAAAYGEDDCLTFPGKVKAASDITLAFRISGPIAHIHVKEGEFVRKGQVLAEMDPRDYQVQLAATTAEYQQIKKEAERVIRLYQQESVSENDYDKAVAGLEQITAKHEAHKNALADTRLTAPFDGYVQECFFDRNETIAAGTPVFSLISAGQPEVTVNIPAEDFVQRERFEAFSCTSEVYPDVVFPLDFISVNQKANLNQLYTMRLQVRGEAGQPVPSPGLSTMVTIRLQPTQAHLVSIPATALFEHDGQVAVWLYEPASQQVKRCPVKPREILNNGTVIVSEGLKAGDLVVTAGVHVLHDGERVEPLPEVSPTNVGGML